MSIKLVNSVVENCPASGSLKLLIIIIANHANQNGEAWPSARRLARLMNASERQVRRLLQEAQAGGLLVRVGTRSSRCGHLPIWSVMPMGDAGCRRDIGDSGGQTSTATRPDIGDTQNHKKILKFNTGGHTLNSGLDVERIKIPPVLAADENFRAAWRDWCEHRRQLSKPLTEAAAKTLLGKLEKMGSPRAVEAIHHSLANGWQGIFEPVSQYPKRVRILNEATPEELKSADEFNTIFGKEKI